MTDSLTGFFAPWLVYAAISGLHIALPRERDDDRRCAKKYGPLWEQYRQQVPWRIVPGIC